VESVNIRKLRESVKMALRSIAGNKVRSFLTALGVMIGVAAVIALVALGNGAQRSVEESLESLGTNLMLIYSGEPKGGSLVRRNTSSIQPAITDEDLADLSELIPSAVARIAPESTSNVQVKFGNVNLNVNLVGTGPDYPAIRNFYPVYGSFITETDDLTRETSAVIGIQIYRDLFADGSDPVGQKIRINGIGFTVVGIMQEKGDATLDSSIYIPISTYQRLYLR
jgi:putative ABC transport system permease protein